MKSLFKRKSKVAAIDDKLKSALERIESATQGFEEQVRKATHNAYAGIVCEVCKLNVYRGEGTWVHGNGGKAYCLDPCWKELHNDKA